MIKEALQQLQKMIYKDQYPTMNGSNRIHHSKAIHILIKILGEITRREKKQEAMNRWILGRNTGVSSKTMWAAIAGVPIDYPDRPYDPSDMARCIAFVRECEISNDDLQKVKQVYPWFAPYVDNWDEIVTLTDSSDLYTYMKILEEESLDIQRKGL
jgi:hypothetical protein